jgi:hypothetical protein
MCQGAGRNAGMIYSRRKKKRSRNAGHACRLTARMLHSPGRTITVLLVIQRAQRLPTAPLWERSAHTHRPTRWICSMPLPIITLAHLQGWPSLPLLPCPARCPTLVILLLTPATRATTSPPRPAPPPRHVPCWNGPSTTRDLPARGPPADKV